MNCPKCGSDKHELDEYSTGPGGLDEDVPWYTVTCDRCGFMSEPARDRGVALSNFVGIDTIRAERDALAAEVERLKSLVGETVQHGQPGVRITWARYAAIEDNVHRLAAYRAKVKVWKYQSKSMKKDRDRDKALIRKLQGINNELQRRVTLGEH